MISHSEFTVIALDPGGTTGYSIATIKRHGEFYFQYAGQQRFDRYSELYAMLESVSPLYVVAESFEFRKGSQKHGIVLESRNILGVCQLWCEIRNRHFCLQSPAVGKAFTTNAKLRERGIYQVAQDHANDATRHLLRWYIFGEGSKWLINYKTYRKTVKPETTDG